MSTGPDKGEKMEVALKWKGYGISIRILGKEAENAAEPEEERVVQSHSAQECREKAERQHLLASGSRYVAPMR
jgi:hypothetical protein